MPNPSPGAEGTPVAPNAVETPMVDALAAILDAMIAGGATLEQIDAHLATLFEPHNGTTPKACFQNYVKCKKDPQPGKNCLNELKMCLMDVRGSSGP